MQSAPLSRAEIDSFHQQGFLIVRGLADAALREAILAVGMQQLRDAVAPIEYEADTRYPGAPASRDATGGLTVRRLLKVYARDEAFRRWAHHPAVCERVKQLLDTPHIALTQAHHNSLMTKQPAFSSVTHWHRDIRYWNFEQNNLISVWLALGAETRDNGCLGFLPGSHRLTLDQDRFENRAFLRGDHPDNQPLLDSAIYPELAAGDVVFFHAETFHAAGWNRTAATKHSLVFGYHRQDNRPIAGTRSASEATVLID
ncbi:phytanoyl-CoA dioxygenase family protein [Chitinimonas sp.]|uniref:phytanoyl-CoA dioxygenase family protein n=1 Tax=Chitinimonas sp. TaxID=1934313 RepID=UPI0035B0CDE5